MRSFKPALWTVLVVAAITVLPRYIGLSINQSNSLPFKVFLLLKKTIPCKGDYVAFTHPRFSRSHTNGPYLIKQAVGVTGDLVQQKNRDLLVGGKNVGVPLLHASDGTTLTPLKFVGFIPKGRFFVAAPHERSFDSRYEEVGLVRQEDIAGVAIPIF